MQFDAQSRYDVLVCDAVAQHGPRGMRSCHGMHAARMVGETLLYVGTPLTHETIALRRLRRSVRRIQIAIGLVIASTATIAGGVLYIKRLQEAERFLLGGSWEASLVSIGFLFFLYVWYRVLNREAPSKHIPSIDPGLPDQYRPLTQWQEVPSVKHGKRVDVWQHMTPEARASIENGYLAAAARSGSTVCPLDLFTALLQLDEVRMLFVRLGVSASRVQQHVSALLPTDRVPASPRVGDEVWQVLFHAFDEAVLAHQQYVDIAELLLTTVRQSVPLQETLYDMGIEAEMLTNAVAWIRMRANLRRQYAEMQRAGAQRNKYGLDRAMTAVATPLLNSFSQDLTRLALLSRLELCVAREKELDEMFRVVEGGRQHVLLVGERGVGKRTLLHGLAQRMIAESVPDRLRDKRLVELSLPSILAGTTPAGAQDRLIRIIREARRAGNIMLVINNIHDVVASGDAGGLDLAETLAEEIRQAQLIVFATTTTQNYASAVRSSQIGQLFTRVDIAEMQPNQAIQVLESKAGPIEYKQRIFFSYIALQKAVELAGTFVYDTPLPGSAIEICVEAASVARQQHGEYQLVSQEDVAHVISDKTGIPVTSVSGDESSQLLKLEQTMHERLVGQDEAVVLVANALRRARASVRSTKRPIANFLFLGPTGVGKTELAKTIAETYFGGEDRMIRLDMSEYQDAQAIYRLTGAPGTEGTGLLTEAVRQRPFSLILLDELEKADPNVLNIFLQVFDDGRLTDSAGHVVDFTNSIIIATSNAGTPFLQQQIAANVPLADIREQLIRGELQQYYRPEFLNRFDAVVLFAPLSQEDVTEIARRMIGGISARVEDERGVSVVATDGAIAALAQKGYDPTFGARPLRRVVQDIVENQLASLFLQEPPRRGTVITLQDDLTLAVTEPTRTV